ncbi:unnamed protein product [Closterium sp. Yama58-4]|nr:unnamed protein product [Closterium sp. Yama58-4]
MDAPRHSTSPTGPRAHFRGGPQPAGFDTKFSELHPDSQKILTHIESKILELRAESQRLGQSSRLHDGSQLADNPFERQAARVSQSLSHVASRVDTERASLHHMLHTAQHLLHHSDLAVRSFSLLRSRFPHLPGADSLAPAQHLLHHSDLAVRSFSLLRSRFPHLPGADPLAPVALFEVKVTEYRHKLTELQAAIEPALADSRFGGSYSRAASAASAAAAVEALPVIIKNLHEFFIHVAAQVERVHERVDAARNAFLAERRRRGDRSNPFAEADRIEAAAAATSATAAGSSPGTSLFGTTTPSLFGSATPGAAAAAAASSPGLSFGNPATPATGTTSLFGTPNPAAAGSSPGSSLFGSTSAFGGGASAFGATPAAGAAASTPSLFGSPAGPTTGGLFGATPAAATPFGAPAASPFGAAGAASPSPFGATASAPGTSLFGAPATPTLQPAAPMPFGFGNTTQAFLYHVKKNNIVSITVDGDKVSFVLRRPEFARGHKATELQPMIRQVEKIAERKWKEAGEASGKKVGKMRPVQVQLSTVKPADVAVPYAELMSRHVEFGAPDKASFKLVNTISSTLLYAGIAAVVLSRLQMKLPQFGGKARSQKGKAPPVLFADVAGVDEAKEELEEIVEYLRTPERFSRLGARPPRGVLLVGPPGTGKTMLAKAVAGEADVPFISCSGSEFVELYVGLGASRVRELFAQAKKDSPSIVFIDEIDAVAKVRDGRMRSVGNDEREQTLNQLLTEMDGFDSSTAVIVLAATNRADVIDPALRRPGRFDRIVAVEPPDRKGREAILTVHVEQKELPLSSDVDIQEIAVATSGFTGADLANLVNEAALLAARRDHEEVTRQDFDSAVERALAGIEKKRSALGRAEKAVVARHEAGHALLGAAIAKVLPDQRVVQKISIVPRSGGALGFAYMPPPADGEERLLVFVDELRGQLAVLLGGRAAEDVCFGGRISTGAVDDIRRATDMAYKAVAEYGLSGTIGPMSVGTLAGGGLDGGGGFGWGGKDQGRLSDQVQDEVQQLLQEALEVARAVLVCNRGLLEDLGRTLQENETVEGAALGAWLAQVEVPPLLRTFVYGRAVELPLLPAESSEEDV